MKPLAIPWSRLKNLDLQTMRASVVAGLVIGVLVVFVRISLAALIFAGELSSYLAAGIGIMLLGTLVAGLIATVYSGFRVSSNGPQDVPAALIAVMASAVVGLSSQPVSFETFSTVVMLMTVSTLLTGIMLWLFGHFNLGRFVRYIPYPVIGGFVAGTGWFLFAGGLSVLNDGAFSQSLFSTDALLLWVPALVFAVAMLVAARRYANPAVMPLVVAISLVVFYLMLFVLNGGIKTGLAKALADGWLMGPLPDGDLWRPVTLEAMQHANWSNVLGNSVGMGTIFLISTISLLLNASGLEILTRSDIDLNRELKVVGCSNIAGAATGCSASYHFLSLSSLMYRMGGDSRLAGVVVALVVGATLVFGTGLLSYAPKPIVAGFLMYLGLVFLAEWLYDGWFTLPKIDYLLIWLILATIVSIGLLQGVAAGVFAALVLFVVAYSKTEVVRHTFTRNNYQSNIMRAPALERLLENRGQGIYLMELQGFIFFGMAHQLLDRVNDRIDSSSASPMRYLVLDFRLVTGLDSSASYAFSRLKQIAAQSNVILLYSNLDSAARTYLKDEGDTDDRESVLIFDDLDHAVAWIDEQEIQAHANQSEGHNALQLVKYFEDALSGTNDRNLGPVADRLQKYMQVQTRGVGSVLIKEGEPVICIYFVESGEVCAQTVTADGVVKKLRVQNAGTVIGEIGLYNKVEATATVTVTKDAELYRMTAADLERMERDDPQLALATHRFIASTLGKKLKQSSYALVALQK